MDSIVCVLIACMILQRFIGWTEDFIRFCASHVLTLHRMQKYVRLYFPFSAVHATQWPWHINLHLKAVGLLQNWIFCIYFLLFPFLKRAEELRMNCFVRVWSLSLSKRVDLPAVHMFYDVLRMSHYSQHVYLL